MNKFYVYVHRRKTDGTIFYVGKGNGNRAWSPHSRSRRWKFTAKKHGYSVEIVLKDAPEKCCLSYERALIFSIGRDRLVNMTDGGDGGINSRPPHNSREVYCSNGMKFSSGNEAARWLRKNGFPKASQAGIGKSIYGQSHHAYGMAWAYDGVPSAPLPRSKRPNKDRKKVYCSNEMIFESHGLAAEWVSNKIGRNASRSAITIAVNGQYKMAFGYAWSSSGFDDCVVVNSYEQRDISLSRPVTCLETGQVHSSMQNAARWLRKNGWPVAEATKISMSCAGKRLKAYGYRWSYV